VTRWTFDDGGRAAAGFRGTAGDCAVRAVAIAGGVPYLTVYDALYDASRRIEGNRATSPRDGVSRRVIDAVLVDGWGWSWTPTMSIGSGTTVHLRADELPAGRLVARVTRHITAVVDGIVHDTYDPTRGGTRAVYGYWTPPAVEVSVPTLFYDDHVSRDLPGGDVVRAGVKMTRVRLDADALANLRSDAAYYASLLSDGGWIDDYTRSIARSGSSTLGALRRAGLMGDDDA
jgi:hypothetical protein